MCSRRHCTMAHMTLEGMLCFALTAVLLTARTYCEDNHQHLNSQIHFERLIYLEREMIEFSESILLGEEEMHDSDVHNFSDIYRFLNKSRLDVDAYNVESITKNPLAIYHLKKRLMREWPDVLERVKESELISKFSIAEAALDKLKGVLYHEAKVEEAVDDILRLQRLYHVTTRSIINGWLETGRAPPFDWDDVLRFATAARDQEDHKLALSYLIWGQDIKRSEKEEISYLGISANMYLLVEQPDEARLLFNKILLLDPNNRGALSNLQVLDMRTADKSGEKQEEIDEDEKKNQLDNKDINTRPTSLETIGKYCRGEVHKTVREESKLMCYDKHLALSNETVRVEELNLSPRMVLIYDVLSHRQRSFLREFAADYLWQSFTQPSQENVSPCEILHGPLTDASAFVDWRSHSMEIISTRLRNLTYQTITRWREDPGILSWMKVTNLGAGGKSDPVTRENHLLHTVRDSLRIAHYLTFLNRPDAGGSIVFPDIKVKVDPEPGASIFWQFRTPKGPVHEKLRRYIECPVLYGTQWIAKSTVEHYNIIDTIRF